MLRKPLLLCLLTLLCLGSLAACGEAPASAEETTTQTEPSQTQETEPSQSQEEAPSLTQLRADLQAGDYFCGIAFLGTLSEGDPAGLPQLLQEKGYAEAYPFLADLPQAQIVTMRAARCTAWSPGIRRPPSPCKPTAPTRKTATKGRWGTPSTPTPRGSR